MVKRMQPTKPRRENIACCPLCRDGVVVYPMHRKEDPECPVCGGTGVVGPKCICGRAAVLDRGNYLVNGLHYCGLEDCSKKIIAGVPNAASTDEDDEEEADLRPPWHGHLY